VTIWGPRLFEPATSAFWAAVERERPDLLRAFEPWKRITEPAELMRLFRAAGAGGAEVEAEAGTQPLQTPEDWWTIASGTGYRATIEKLGRESAERVRSANLSWLRDHQVTSVETNVVYGIATKPD
jgi:hypothetical protein